MKTENIFYVHAKAKANIHRLTNGKILREREKDTKLDILFPLTQFMFLSRHGALIFFRFVFFFIICDE